MDVAIKLVVIDTQGIFAMRVSTLPPLKRSPDLFNDCSFFKKAKTAKVSDLPLRFKDSNLLLIVSPTTGFVNHYLIKAPS
jgi:hypothetical protein